MANVDPAITIENIRKAKAQPLRPYYRWTALSCAVWLLVLSFMALDEKRWIAFGIRMVCSVAFFAVTFGWQWKKSDR